MTNARDALDSKVSPSLVGEFNSSAFATLSPTSDVFDGVGDNLRRRRAEDENPFGPDDVAERDSSVVVGVVDGPPLRSSAFFG